MQLSVKINTHEICDLAVFIITKEAVDLNNTFCLSQAGDH